MPDARPSSTSMPPPDRGPKKTTLTVLILLFAGGTWGVYHFMIRDDEPPPTATEPPPPVERNTTLTTAEPEPPPLPETAAPPEDAGSPTKRKGHGGGMCTGTIDQAAVRAYARSHMGPLRSCYERRLKVNNLLQGRVLLKMLIGTTGRISRTSVLQNTIYDAEVVGCVRQAVARWTLPAPTGGCVYVEYPFSFSPRER